MKNNGKHLPTTFGRDIYTFLIFAVRYYQSKRQVLQRIYPYINKKQRNSERHLRKWNITGKLLFQKFLLEAQKQIEQMPEL